MIATDAQSSAAGHAPGGPGAPESSRGGLRTCMEKAEELLQVLEEEAEELRNFQGSRLLELLPRKEALTRELFVRVQALKQESERQKIPIAGLYRALKGSLDEIVRLNRSNAVFIEGSLAYYNGLMDCVLPTSYGRGHDAASRRKIAVKGLAVSKEV